MKNFLSLGLLLLTIGCTNKTRYTQQSPEIETIRSVITNYVNGEWDEYASHYAEGAAIFYNTTEESSSSIQEIIAGQKLGIEPLSSYSFERDEDEFEMVLTDEGETWVNFWGVWKGTIAATGETFETPIHITSQFEDGKIVKAFGYWNSAPLQIALMKMQTAATEGADTEQ